MLPEITHLQFVVLCSLLSAEAAGREIRATLAKEGVKKSRPSFYQLMGRLEEAGLVEGWYENDFVGRQVVRERLYRITADGKNAVLQFRAFVSRNLAFG